MEEALKEKNAELVSLEHLAHLLMSLGPAEMETLELLLDSKASGILKTSLKELDQGKGIALAQW
ncbi:hypothetical protein J7K60_02620 [Candidatus Bipolaricaulota bacterium]|nr:hypothetical protein [Candidatus Bipolaricaulota bacterium]